MSSRQFRRRRIPAIAVLSLCPLLLVFVPSAQGQVGPITLSNAQVQFTVNPSIGRVVYFGTANNNTVWNNDPAVLSTALPDHTWSLDLGGDKLWPAPQWEWDSIAPGESGEWPPIDPDGRNYSVSAQTGNSVTILSPSTSYPTMQVQASRQFTLDPTSAHLQINNTLTAVGRTALTVSASVNIWSVSQMVSPSFALLDIASDSPAGTGTYTNLGNDASSYVTMLNGGTALEYTAPNSSGLKIGTDGRWIAAVYPTTILLEKTSYDPTAAYGDGTDIECYSGGGYMEMETLSPDVVLPLNGHISNQVDWYLLARPSGMTDAQLATYLSTVPEPATLGLLLAVAPLLLVALRRRTR